MGILRIERYEQPVTLAEALTAMNTGGRVKALAGGTDLAIQLHEREIDVDTIVDLSRVKKLKEISLKADGLHIGAMATFTQIEHDALVQQYCPMLAKAASMVGSPQVRNSGTVGGNLANAATAADSVPVMMAMDAQVVVMSEAASRVLPAMVPKASAKAQSSRQLQLLSTLSMMRSASVSTICRSPRKRTWRLWRKRKNRRDFLMLSSGRRQHGAASCLFLRVGPVARKNSGFFGPAG